MSMTQLYLDNSFLKELSNTLKTPNEEQTFQLLCAVLQAIRHQLTVEESTYFEDKLPTSLKDLYIAGCEVNKNEVSTHSRDTFFEEVYQLSGGKMLGVFKNEEQVKEYVEKVIDWLRGLVGNDVLPILPIRLRIYIDTYKMEGQSTIY